MKISVGDLKPNPFRKMKTYPINKAKVDLLKRSMKETGFWDNILARKVDGTYQIAYGHHRLAAIKKIYGANHVIDIPVKKLNDATMIRIMANENDQDYDTSPSVINETVKVTREFIEKTGKLASGTPGARVIAQFLGGNWTEDRVSNALRSLRLLAEKKLDQEAFAMLPSQRSVRNLARAISSVETKYKKKVPARMQRRIAEKAANDGISEAEVKEMAIRAIIPQDQISKSKPNIDNFIDGEFRLTAVKLSKMTKQLNGSKKHIKKTDLKRVAQVVQPLIKNLQLLMKGI